MLPTRFADTNLVRNLFPGGQIAKLEKKTKQRILQASEVADSMEVNF